jgi:hypothetical protein
MIEDYAIEPACFRSAESVRYLLEKFGFHQGRFLVTYPAGWVSKVREALALLPDMQRKRAIDFLARYRDERIIERADRYDMCDSWAGNAAHAVRDKVLDKAICAEGNPFGIKTYDEVDESFFAHSQSGRLLANAANYSMAVRRLLEISREAVLVDPYFQFSRPGRIKVLKAFFSEAKRTACKSLVLFGRAEVTANQGLGRFQAAATEFCRNSLDKSQCLRVRLVDDSGRPNAMHARYMFSRKGGISFDKGFQEEPVETYVDLALLTPELLSEQIRLYLDGEHGHTVVDSFAWKNGKAVLG